VLDVLRAVVGPPDVGPSECASQGEGASVVSRTTTSLASWLSVTALSIQDICSSS
jgi:hypothetical protein